LLLLLLLLPLLAACCLLTLSLPVQSPGSAEPHVANAAIAVDECSHTTGPLLGTGPDT